ncbi:MAG: hypothetical protein WCW13_05365 [archaeon]|jgi:hypothetical protein
MSTKVISKSKINLKQKVDLDYFLREWYWEGKNKINKRYNLSSINLAPTQLKALLKERSFLGISTDFPKQISKNGVVIGGPCITDSKENITIESVNDITNIILVAKALNLPALIYLSIKEEEIRSNKEWIGVKDHFEKLINQISEMLEYKNIKLIDTSEKEVNSLIENFLDSINSQVTKDELNKLYYIGNNDHRLKQPYKSTDELKISIHKRFLVTYLPEFISKLTNITNPDVFVVENIQQVKAILRAKNISKTGRLFHLAYLPTPNLTGKMRMYSSTADFKVFLDQKDQVSQALKTASDKSINYYFSIIPNNLNQLENKSEANLIMPCYTAIQKAYLKQNTKI